MQQFLLLHIRGEATVTVNYIYKVYIKFFHVIYEISFSHRCQLFNFPKNL